jgi:uncharacterized repeat protein (TIGR03803 family)
MRGAPDEDISMKSSKPLLTLGLALGCAAIIFSLAVRAQAQIYTTVAIFNGFDGDAADAAFIQTTNGNLYSITYSGGADSQGNVFEMTPGGKMTNLYSFCGCVGGSNPSSGIILASGGNFYGTTESGGNGTYGQGGTVFKMSLGGKLTTLYTFCSAVSCADGRSPWGLVQASGGNFYGTTNGGGPYGEYGTVFQITPAGDHKVLYNFCSQSNCVDGAAPYSPPLQGSNGNFYGAALGGTQGKGVVYEITPAGLYRVLHNFCSDTNCADGAYPSALVQDAIGNLYGTTNVGGDANGYGTVFKITPTNQYVVLHTFGFSDGANPTTGLILANDGNLYGTTTAGGEEEGGGIFQITSSGVFTLLYSFCNVLPSCTRYPSGLFQGTNGFLYGTTPIGGQGGQYGYGEAFSLSNGLSPLVETVPVAGKIGQRIIILGNGLTGSISVTFNGTPAEFTVESDTYIKATVPEGATSGTLSVATPTGPLNSNPEFRVTK